MALNRKARRTDWHPRVNRNLTIRYPLDIQGDDGTMVL